MHSNKPRDISHNNNEIMKRMENTIEEMKSYRNNTNYKENTFKDNKDISYDKSPGRSFNK